MSVTIRRQARKAHRCDGCGRAKKIQPGDVYLTHTALAGDDAYHDSLDRLTLKPANRPQRYAECADCAIRSGRAELLEPPEDGPCEAVNGCIKINRHRSKCTVLG